jgi:hypothetical protein
LKHFKKTVVLFMSVMVYPIAGLADNVTTPTHFVSGQPPRGFPNYQELQDSMDSDWASGQWAEDDYGSVQILASITADGYKNNVQIVASLKNAQNDWNCLQAVLGCKPLSVKGYEYPVRAAWIFYVRDPKQGYKTASISTFSKSHTNSKQGLVTFRIPLSVLHRYPGLFTENELLGPENLMMFENENAFTVSDGALLHLCRYYENWNKFFNENSSPTRKNLEDQRDKRK